MDEGFFINREAKMVGRELEQGDPVNAANLLREDCQHMNPREFSRLVTQTANSNDRNNLANLEIERDGDVVVQANDGRRYNAGRLAYEEARRLMPEEPAVVYAERPRREPDVVIIDREHDHDHDHDRYNQPRYQDRQRGLGSTATDVIAGGLIGAGVSRRGHEVQGAAVGVGAGLLLDQLVKGVNDHR